MRSSLRPKRMRDIRRVGYRRMAEAGGVMVESKIEAPFVVAFASSSLHTVTFFTTADYYFQILSAHLLHSYTAPENYLVLCWEPSTKTLKGSEFHSKKIYQNKRSRLCTSSLLTTNRHILNCNQALPRRTIVMLAQAVGHW